MVYYTQLIFVKAGQEATFQQFEDRVLPLLDEHNGELLYRARPAAEALIASTVGTPYEVHLVSFQSCTDFERYRDDPRRTQHTYLKDQSVERVMLIEGTLL